MTLPLILTITLWIIALSFSIGLIAIYTGNIKEEPPTLYKNKSNGVYFEEVTRYATESVMLRKDVNIMLLIPHTELAKRYEKIS